MAGNGQWQLAWPGEPAPYAATQSLVPDLGLS